MDELESRLTRLETTQGDIEFQLLEMRREVKKTIEDLSQKLDKYIEIENIRRGSESTIKAIISWLGVGSFIALITVMYNQLKGH